MKYLLILIVLILVGCANKHNQTGWNDLKNIKEQPINNDIPKIELEILNK